jgi:hypothetical protein
MLSLFNINSDLLCRLHSMPSSSLQEFHRYGRILQYVVTLFRRILLPKARSFMYFVACWLNRYEGGKK